MMKNRLLGDQFLHKAFLLMLCLPGWGTARAGMEGDELLSMDIEDLLSIPVAGVTRTKTDSFHTPMATFVLTREDIRRSGFTSVPELLRMVPGFNVGRLSSNMWAVNARAPNRRLSRDLLVMIDGRNVYSPTVNNVFWDSIGVILEEIERIEVIRGPGSSLWGANAASGIINIVTRHSEGTLGGMGYAQAATAQLDHDLAARYGYGQAGNSGRVYARAEKIGRSTYPPLLEQSRVGSTQPGATGFDGQELTLGGVRHDVALADDMRLMLNLELSHIHTEEAKTTSGMQPIHLLQDQQAGFALARLEVDHSESSTSTVQFYADRAKRENPDVSDDKLLFDLDFQNETRFDGFDALWGLGYRSLDHEYLGNNHMFGIALIPPDERLEYYSGFVQADIKLPDEQSSLVIGTKYEHNPYTGSEWMPSIRVSHQADDKQFLWAGYSRTVSEPSRFYADGYLDISDVEDCSEFAGFGAILVPGFGCAIPAGGPDDLYSGVVNAWEAGWRFQFGGSLMFDHALFYNDYRKVNGESERLDHVAGYELAVRYLVNDRWELNAFYAYADGSRRDGETLDSTRYMPQNTFGLRSNFDLTERVDIDLFFRHADEVALSAALNELDIRLGYRPTEDLELSLLLSNLLDDQHVEYNADQTRANTVVERAALLKLTFRF